MIKQQKYFIGLDLGQAADYTALSILRKVPEKESIYHVVHLERFPLGTKYPVIVKRVCQLMSDPQLGDFPVLVVDATGVGMPVVDMLRAARLEPVAVSITFGAVVNQTPQGYSVPKRDLVMNLAVLLQTNRLLLAKELAAVDILTRELMNFSVKVTPVGNETFAALREGQHDDMVLSVALAAWYAERIDAQFWAIPMSS